MRNKRRDENVITGRRGDADFGVTVMEYELGVPASHKDRGLGFVVMVIVRHRLWRKRVSPIQIFSDPTELLLIAANRRIPAVCAVSD